MSFQVLVVDDHELTVMGLNLTLAGAKEYEVCEVLSTGATVIDFVKDNLVDIIILDVQLPDMNGTDLLAELVGGLDATVIILSGTGNTQVFDRALKLGARAIVAKSDPVEEILNALNTVMAGAVYLTKSVSDSLGAKVEPIVSLSPRQAAILHLLELGETNKEISYRLSISAPTVSFHLKELRRKLDVVNNNPALSRARELRLM